MQAAPCLLLFVDAAAAAVRRADAAQARSAAPRGDPRLRLPLGCISKSGGGLARRLSSRARLNRAVLMDFEAALRRSLSGGVVLADAHRPLEPPPALLGHVEERAAHGKAHHPGPVRASSSFFLMNFLTARE